jgi:gamma-glutamyltranspeptidase/glutathione hydrolase
MLHNRHGKLPWKELFQPAIHLARDGFQVNVDLADAIAQYVPGFILDDPLFAAVYAPNGTALKEGDMCYRPTLANTLEMLAEGGADVFYTGKLAQGIVDTTGKTGGIMTLDDLAGYEAIIREPVNITYRSVQVQCRVFGTQDGLDSFRDTSPATSGSSRPLPQAQELS